MQHALDVTPASTTGATASGTNRRSILSRLSALVSRVRGKAAQPTQAAEGRPDSRPVLPPEFIDELTGRS